MQGFGMPKCKIEFGTEKAVRLTERLLRAAAALRFHREFVPVRIVGADGALQACELVGPGKSVGLVQVRGWWDAEQAGRAVRIEEIALPADVAQRLEGIAAMQAMP